MSQFKSKINDILNTTLGTARLNESTAYEATNRRTFTEYKASYEPTNRTYLSKEFDFSKETLFLNRVKRHPTNSHNFDNLNSLPGKSVHNPKIVLPKSSVFGMTGNRAELIREDLKDLKSFSPSKSSIYSNKPNGGSGFNNIFDFKKTMSIKDFLNSSDFKVKKDISTARAHSNGMRDKRSSSRNKTSKEHRRDPSTDIERFCKNRDNIRKEKFKKEIQFMCQSILQDSSTSILSKKSVNSPTIDLSRPEMEINSKTYFAYSPSYQMRETKYQKERHDHHTHQKKPRDYYKNYLINSQDVFNKNYDKQRAILNSSHLKHHHAKPETKGFTKKPSTSVIHEKLEKLKLNAAFQLNK